MFKIIGAVVYPAKSPNPGLSRYPISTAQMAVRILKYAMHATPSTALKLAWGMRPNLLWCTRLLVDAKAVRASGMNPKQKAVTGR